MAQEYVVLQNGAKMPIFGLGTWKSKEGEVGKAVKWAIEAGYRHIDCASAYDNEPEIGSVLTALFENNVVKREEIFITSKLWNTKHKKEHVRSSCEKTLKDLNLKYLDLYLIHWPIAFDHDKPKDNNGKWNIVYISIQETWRAMEELQEAGLVKGIGVSNMTAIMLSDLLGYAKIPPVVNQVEMHPYLPQDNLVKFSHKHNVQITAYSPLGSLDFIKEKDPKIIDDPVILELAQKHKKSAAQILIRWAIERHTVVIPKSVNEVRIKENFNVFDFTLNTADMKKIETINRNYRFLDPVKWGWDIPAFD